MPNLSTRSKSPAHHPLLASLPPHVADVLLSRIEAPG
jgi:hypothetical protein